jgi:hypothetical protein
MLGYRRLADLTADSMVQCLMVPTETFMSLVRTESGVYTRAWQATAAQLAAQHHHILGEHVQLAPLNMFFRYYGQTSCFPWGFRLGFMGTTEHSAHLPAQYRRLFVLTLHDVIQRCQMCHLL